MELEVIVFGNAGSADIRRLLLQLRRLGLKARSMELTGTADRARKLFRLSSTAKHRLILDGPVEVFARNLPDGEDLAFPSADIAMDAAGRLLYLAPTEIGRRFLHRLVRRATANPELSWGDLLRAAAVAGGHGGTVVSLAAVPDRGIANIANCSVVIDRIEERGDDVSVEAIRTRVIAWSEAAAKEERLEEAAVFLTKAIELGHDDRDAPYALAKLYLRMERFGKVAQVLRRLLGAEYKRDSRALSLVLSAVHRPGGDREAAHRLCDTLTKLGDPSGVAHARSVRFELELDDRAAALGLADAARPALWWMTGPYPGNFGDIVNPYVVEKLSGVPPRRAKAGDGMLAIGSVIKFARAGTKVWGTGSPRTTDTLNPMADYRAVRGPITREVVLKSGGQVPELYGDAAMLLPLVYRPEVQKRHRVGLIRHFSHLPVPLRIADDVHEISILRVGYPDVEGFLQEMLACDFILSTSLHGLIVAHAYGIPTRWCDMGQTGRRIAGDGVKFRDHYAALGIPCEGPLDLTSFEEISSDLAEYCVEVPTKPLDAVGLLRAAPFAVLPEMIERARSLQLPCRPAVQPGRSNSGTNMQKERFPL